MKKRKYYVVWEGRTKGIFNNWDDCKESIHQYEGAQYKSFSSETEAIAASKMNYWQCVQKEKNNNAIVNTKGNTEIVRPSICVDAACSGNPGDMEYRGVDLETGKEIFHSKVFKEGTNNIGEFLALVHGLSLLKLRGFNHAIYSDSETAICWIRNRKCNTKLMKTLDNVELFELIKRAELWLEKNSYTTRILKWDTEKWGEIPADFGRK